MQILQCDILKFPERFVNLKLRHLLFVLFCLALGHQIKVFVMGRERDFVIIELCQIDHFAFKPVNLFFQGFIFCVQLLIQLGPENAASLFELLDPLLQLKFKIILLQLVLLLLSLPLLCDHTVLARFASLHLQPGLLH